MAEKTSETSGTNTISQSRASGALPSNSSTYEEINLEGYQRTIKAVYRLETGYRNREKTVIYALDTDGRVDIFRNNENKDNSFSKKNISDITDDYVQALFEK